MNQSPKQVARAREIFKACVIPRFCPQDCNCRKHHSELMVPGSIIEAVATAISNAEERGEIREREACAKVAYYHKDIELFPKPQNQYDVDRGEEVTRFSIAKAIRARSKKEVNRD